MIFAQFWMDIANLRGPASTDVISLQNQLRSLESQLRDKDAYINSLEKRSGPISYARGDTVARLNNLLDRCQTISSRMLDAICRSIPTWQSDVATVNEIREDVVCSLENVETILNELLARRNETSDSIITKSQDLYRMATGNMGLSSVETNVSSVMDLLNQTLNQLHAANLYDLSVCSYYLFHR